MQMLQWKKSRGRQYVFFQSHPGFAFGDENVTREFYDQIMCKEVGDALHLVVERGQRWKCPTNKDGPLLPPLLPCHSASIFFSVALEVPHLQRRFVHRPVSMIWPWQCSHHTSLMAVALFHVRRGKGGLFSRLSSFST